ncbi:MAG: transglycosylase domain-containing protein [bacterium]
MNSIIDELKDAKDIEKARENLRLRRERRRKKKIFAKLILLLILFSSASFIIYEFQTSWLQAKIFSYLDSKITFWMEPGASQAIHFPSTGPYDQRLGYSRIQDSIDNLIEKDFIIESQARSSPLMLKLTKRGLFPIYNEKTQGGLAILDRNGQELFSIRYPGRVYDSFESIPKIIVDTLLFIENRELLDSRYPYKNPAVEWDRFAKAILDMAIHTVYKGHKAIGGSTMATQLEKYRHSPEGRTSTGKEKIKQMLSASFRSYINGEENMEARRKLVVDYINSVPLAAINGYGEVNGLGDGLWAWYGADFDSINRCLSSPSEDIEACGLAFKQVLSLFLAHRRPSYYLVEDQEALKILTNRYIKILAKAGIISKPLSMAALKAPLELRNIAPPQPEVPFLKLKAANSVRTNLASIMCVPKLYDLDRFDLTVNSTIDKTTQEEVMKVFEQLKDPEYAKSVGVTGFRLLNPDNLSEAVYSFTLYEREGNANLLRVQADSLNQPLNINEGIKLELGSTAKLRTLITYLEILAGLHEKYSKLSPEELKAIQVPSADNLSRWAIEFLLTSPDKSLKAMMHAAMERRYSGNPGEKFFTGGGVHTFVNFESWENSKMATVREALQDSINLSFIRIMRDIVNYYTYQIPGSTAKILDDINNPKRKEYLKRFADQEGKIFINRFYKKYQKKNSQEIMDMLVSGVRPIPSRLAVTFRSVKPDASINEFATFMRSNLEDQNLTYEDINELYTKYSKSAFNLADRGYIARIHPLELWTAEYLLNHPDAKIEEVLEASKEERQEVYSWLFKTNRKHAQDIRIRTLIEVEAFQEIHRMWKRLGYPFDYLTPSLATAIGSSGDRPAALAELVGIIQNNGVRYPSTRIERLHFAKDTPYETVMEISKSKGEQVIAPEIAEVVKSALINVVENGTAKRLNKAFIKSDGSSIPVGGKTGTGDNRRDIYGPRGRLIESKVISRTATFVFLIGDRFFGTITVYVEGPGASNHKFTSSLPVQLMKVLAPKLMPLIEGKTKIHKAPVLVQKVTPKTAVKTPSIEQKTQEVKVDQPKIFTETISDKDQQIKTEDKKITYTVKLGTFSSQENAEKLINSLKSLGYSPRLISENIGGQEVHHVYIGKFDDSTKAKEFGESLQGKSSYITDFLIKETPK